MFRRHSEISKSGSEENPFLLSFSDLMAGLLAIFILVLVVTLIELEKRKDEVDLQKREMAKEKEKIKVSLAELRSSLEEIQILQNGIASALSGVSQRERSLAEMLARIQKDLKDKGIDVVIAENGTVLRIPEQQLQFALGKYDIPPGCVDAATAIGKALIQSLSLPENQALLDTVFIEGHTDSVANAREMGNWGLSTYRAISLWNYWTETPGEVAGLKLLRTRPTDRSQMAKPLISVSGYSDTRSTHGLHDGTVLKEDRPEDRRIDIRFTLVSSEKFDLEELKSSVSKMREKTDDLVRRLRSNDAP